LANLDHLGCRDHQESLAKLEEKDPKDTEDSLVCKAFLDRLDHLETRAHLVLPVPMVSRELLAAEAHLALMELWEPPVFLVPLVPEDLRERKESAVRMEKWVHPVHLGRLASLLVMMLPPSLHFLVKEHQRVLTH